MLGGAAAVAASAGAGLALAVHGRGGHHSTASSTTETSPPPNHAVAVQIAGTGVGSIGGPGLACPSDCSTSIQDGRTITLTETHGSDSVFEGWSPGDCARSPTCKLRVTAGITVVATFSRTESTAPGAPLAPTGLAATSVSATQVDLAWFKPTGKVAVDHYVIYRDQQPVGNVPAQQTSYEDTRVTPSTRYVYSVVAVAADQKASPSSSSTQATTLPSAPTLLSPKEPVKGEIDLEWTPAFPNPAGSYIVYRDGNKAEVVPGTQTSFSDTPVDTSVDHTYTVQAIDQFGKSSPQSNPGDFSPVG